MYEVKIPSQMQVNLNVVWPLVRNFILWSSNRKSEPTDQRSFLRNPLRKNLTIIFWKAESMIVIRINLTHFWKPNVILWHVDEFLNNFVELN